MVNRPNLSSGSSQSSATLPTPLSQSRPTMEGLQPQEQPSLCKPLLPSRDQSQGKAQLDPNEQQHRTSGQPQVQPVVTGAQPWLFPHGVGWPPRYWGIPNPMEPPPIKAMFDESPKKLVFFLNEVWAHLDHYGSACFNDVVCMHIIVVNLEGEAAE